MVGRRVGSVVLDISYSSISKTELNVKLKSQILAVSKILLSRGTLSRIYEKKQNAIAKKMLEINFHLRKYIWFLNELSSYL